MVQLQVVRDYMKKLAEADRKRHTVQVSGRSIDEALEQASIELGIPISNLEYELLQDSSSGFLGYWKKECILIAYEVTKSKKESQNIDDYEMDLDGLYINDNVPVDKNGEAIVKFRQKGVFLKILAPIGNGKRLTEKEAIAAIKKRGVNLYEKAIVAEAVKNADGELIRIADYNYNPANDQEIIVDIDDSEMTAIVTIKEPKPGGTDITCDDVIETLSVNGVVFGINEKEIIELADHPIYNKAIVVAKGEKAKHGKDAKIIYNFNKNDGQIDLKEKQGRIDFKEMNKIHNVVKGQVLAKKIPLEEGKPGKTVTGTVLPAKNGKDVKFNIGKNVILNNDGLAAIAEINGQAILSKGRLSVAPVYVVEGDVNLKSGGNVIFLGSVIVKGSVDEGFKVKASGNIEIFGNVGKAEIDAEGDVIVHQGINGKVEGKVRAGKKVYSKFIENVNVDGAEAVIATDGIINSNVVSKGVIICMGKRATIVGGRLRAAKEIHAKTIGSPSGSETILEVGWDPKSKERLEKLEDEIERIAEKFEDVERNILTLENLKKKKKEFSEEKIASLEDFQDQKIKLKERKQSVEDEIKEIQAYLSTLEYAGKISASARINPGVRIYIKDAFLKVRTEYNKVTLKNEKGNVKVEKYEPLKENLTIG